METTKQKKLRKLIKTLKLHQQLSKTHHLLEEYLKKNNTSNGNLMEEVLACMDKIDITKNNLRIEADKNDSWDNLMNIS